MTVEQDFIRCYEKWKNAIKKMPHYSKSTAYVQIPEYRDIVGLGSKCIPFLLDKLIKNREVDFFLTDAVIEILNWNNEDFPQTDLEKKRLTVIKKLRLSEKRR
jgi:hypothetical protein